MHSTFLDNGVTRRVRTVGLIAIILVIFFAQTSFAAGNFSDFPDVGSRFLDVQEFLYRVAGRNGWSLIVSSNLNSSLKEVKGSSTREILHNYLKGTGFSYKFSDNCLYVGPSEAIEVFFKRLPELEIQLPSGQPGPKFSGVFKKIDLQMLCRILRSISGVEIRVASDLQMNLMMRVKSMSWQRILLSIIYLNGLNLNMTDFSVVISS